MSVAQQISELLSLKRDGVLSAEDVAFAIRELRAGAVSKAKITGNFSEQKVASKKRSPKKVKASPVVKASPITAPAKAVVKKSRPKIETSTERHARLKAAREERQRADEESALASLSERDMEALTWALNDQ